MMQDVPTEDDAGRTWWAWSGVAVRPVSDPLSEPVDTLVLAGPGGATEADATRAFLRWFHLLRSDARVNRDAERGLGEEWTARPLRDGADRPHDPLAWDGRDIAVATLAACRTIEDLEALGNLFPLAKTLFGDRATRPLARAIAESVFETVAQERDSFSAIRLAVALAPLCSSEQLVEVLSWDDRGELVVPAGQIRALADDLLVLFGHINSSRRRLALVEGAWTHALDLAEVASDISVRIRALARRREASVLHAAGYIERVAAGGTDELHEVLASLLGRAILELPHDHPSQVWRLPGFVRDRAQEAVTAALLCPGIGRRTLRRGEHVELYRIERRRIMTDLAGTAVQRFPWLQSPEVTTLTESNARRQLERDELRQWTELGRETAQAVRPAVTAPWMLDRWPADLVGLINLVANHHRLTRTFQSGSSSRARTWVSFARDVSSFDLGDLAVPGNSWVDGLDGAVLPCELTVSIARSSKTLLDWSDHMGNCIHSHYRLDAMAGEIIFVGLSEANGALRYNASLSPTTGRLLEIAARFNDDAPDEVEEELQRLAQSLWQREQRRTLEADDTDIDGDVDASGQRRTKSRGGARPIAAKARGVLTQVDTDLKRDDPVRDRAMQLVLDLGEELSLRRGDWRVTVRRLVHVDDEQLRRALMALGATRARQAQRKAFLEWDPLDGLQAPEPLVDALASVRVGADEAETTRPIRVLRSLELRTRWLLARLQQRVASMAN